MKFVHDKSFYKNFAVLTISIALQNLLTYSVNLADNLMLGRFSQNALSGAALCNQIQFLLQMLVVGVGEGVVVIGSQYWGRNNLKPVPDIIGAGLRFGLGMALAVFTAVFFFPEKIIRLMSNDGAVIAEAVKYLRIICFTYLIFALTNMLVASLRAIGEVRIGYILSLSTLCINICLNWVFIFGNLGAPVLGIQGAAIATLTSRIAELVILIFFLKYREHRLNLSLKKLVFIDKSFIRDFFHVSLPIIIAQAFWGLMMMVQTGILGNMDNSGDITAANAVSVLLCQIITVVGYGAAAAAGIITGKSVGEGDNERIKQNTRTFQLMFLGIGVVTGLIIYFLRYPVMQLYPKLSPEARRLTLQFTAVMSAASVGTCYQMACDTGIIRAGGDTKFQLYNNSIFLGSCLCVAALCAFVLHSPPVVVFFWLKADQILKCITVGIRVNSYKWIRKVTR
ncbi:MAG: MATE family efflux transporter [Candidatus Limivicinus sp.]|jgi:putative MATE family efflux protein